MRVVAAYISFVLTFVVLVLPIPPGAMAQSGHAHDHPEMSPVEGQLRAEYVIQIRFDPRTKRIHGVVEIASRDTTLWGSSSLELSVPERGTTFDSVFYRGRLLDSVPVPFRGGQTAINLPDTIEGPQPFYLRINYSCPWILHGWEPDKSAVAYQVPFSRWCPRLQFKRAVTDARESYRAAITVDKQYRLNSSAELLNEVEHYGTPGRGDGITRALHAYEGNWDSDDRLYLFRAERVTDFSLVWTRGMALDRVQVGDTRLHLLYPQDSDSDRYDSFLTAYEELFRYLQTKLGEPRHKYVSTVVFTDVDERSLSSDGILIMPDHGRSETELMLLSAHSLIGDRLLRETSPLSQNIAFPANLPSHHCSLCRKVSLLEAMQGFYLTEVIAKQYGEPGLRALQSYLSGRKRWDPMVICLVDGATRLRLMANILGDNELDIWINSVRAVLSRENDPEEAINVLTDSLLGIQGRALWDHWPRARWVCDYRLLEATPIPGASVIRAKLQLGYQDGFVTSFELGLISATGDRKIVTVPAPDSVRNLRFEIDIPIAGTKPEFIIIDPRGRLPLLNRETASYRLSYYHPHPPKVTGWYPAFEILVDRFTR